MTKLRPECGIGDGTAISLPNDTALYLIKESVERRGILIHGRLHDGRGNHCAIGSFWQDNPQYSLPSSLVDEVAAVNDSIPPTSTPKERWIHVRKWLRWKIKVLAGVTTNKTKTA